MFKANAKVDVALNRDVEHLIKTGGKEGILPIVQMGSAASGGCWRRQKGLENFWERWLRSAFIPMMLLL